MRARPNKKGALRAIMYRTVVRCRPCRDRFEWHGKCNPDATMLCRKCGQPMQRKVLRVMGRDDAVALLKARAKAARQKGKKDETDSTTEQAERDCYQQERTGEAAGAG